MPMMKLLKRIGRCDFGGTAIEYGLIVSLVVIACIGALESVANETDGMWATIKTKVTAVM